MTKGTIDTLTGSTVDTVELAAPTGRGFTKLLVTNHSGADRIDYVFDAVSDPDDLTAPTEGGDNQHYLPAVAGIADTHDLADHYATPPSNLVIKLISAGAEQYSVEAW